MHDIGLAACGCILKDEEVQVMTGYTGYVGVGMAWVYREGVGMQTRGF